VGAYSSYRMAVEEIAKAHLITQAAAFHDPESDKWRWFWSAFYEHTEKLKLLEHEFHQNSFRDEQELASRIKLMKGAREKAIYVDFDSGSMRFWTPRERFEAAGNLRETAELERNCARLVFAFITAAGTPDIKTTLAVYKIENRRRAKRFRKNNKV
jgi:AbiV family abortive infection protein